MEQNQLLGLLGSKLRRSEAAEGREAGRENHLYAALPFGNVIISY